MRRRAEIFAAAAILALTGTVAHSDGGPMGWFKLAVPRGPYFPASRVPLQPPGAAIPFTFSVAGPGRIAGSFFIAPSVAIAARSTIVAASPYAMGAASLQTRPAPSPRRRFLAVATYQDGIVLHDPRTFRILGYVAIGGPPGDVAATPSGGLAAPDTDGDALYRLRRHPWTMARIRGVSEGNEVLAAGKDLYVSDRDAGGKGALTKIAPNGTVTRVVTGLTAEGLAYDPERNMMYVGNVNDGTVAQVDVRTMRVVRKIPSVERTFGIAFEPRTQRLFVVSNTSPSMHARGGYVEALAVSRGGSRVTARSAHFVFPLGIALDPVRKRAFVTDEGSDRVYVLNSTTLRPAAKPLRTCDTPWRPRIFSGRLYVPCARSNEVDVFDTATLRRVPRAPFATGRFPLSVTLAS